VNICLLFRDTGPKRLTGGASRAVLELAACLSAEGHRVALLTESSDIERDGLDAVSVRLLTVPNAPIGWSDAPPETARHNLMSAAAAYREVRAIDEREWPVDAVLTTLHRSEGALCVLDRRFPTIVTCNTSLRTLSELDPAYRALEDLDTSLALERAALARSEYLHGLTRSVLEKTIADYGLTPRFQGVVGRGVRDRGWVQRGVAEDAPPSVLFVGRIEHRKGVDILLKAAEELLEDGIRASFTLVGRPADSPLREDFEGRNRDRPELLQAVRFLGPVGDAELERLFIESDLVCQPARYESHGIVIVEAMMHGRPIVTCGAGGIGEVVTDGVNALLAAPEDPRDLARQLRRLISDRELRVRLGSAGRESYEQNFDAQVVARRTAMLMAEAVGVHEPVDRRPEELRDRVSELLVDAELADRAAAPMLAEELLSGRPAGRAPGSGAGRPLELDPQTEATRQALTRAALEHPPRERHRESTGAPRISAVVMTRSRPELLGRALESIARQEVRCTVLVIDQGSSAEMAPQIAAACARHEGVELHRLEVNLGAPAGRNLGVELTEGEFVLFLDDDAELLPGALAHMLDVLDVDPAAEAVSATVVTPDGLISHSGGRFQADETAVIFSLTGFGEPFAPDSLPPTGPADWVGGTAFLARRTLLEAIPFDPGMSTYYEDNEWAYRVGLSRPGCMRRSREALALHYLAGRQVGARERFDTRRLVGHLASCARFHERHGLLLGPFSWELLPDRVAVGGDLGLGDVRLLMELITAKGEDWTLAAWEAGELENLLQANKLREQVERTHPELEALRPEVPRLNRVIAEQHEATRWLIERDLTPRQALRRPGQPRLDDDLLERLLVDRVEPYEHRGDVVEVRCREEDARVIGQQRLLGKEMLDAGPQDRARGRQRAELLDFLCPERALPDGQLGHVLECDERTDGLAARELGVDRRDVHHQALALAPLRPPVHRNRAGRLERRHPCVVGQPSLLVEVFEIGPRLAHVCRLRERAVTRDEHGRVELLDPQAGGDPVGDRADPGDRVGSVEEDVAGEHHPLGGQEGQRVATGVRRADLDQAHLALADLEAQLAAERLRGQHRLDAREVEGSEAAQEELAQRAHVRRLLDERRHRRRRQLGHLGGRPLGGDDPRARDELIAVTVIAVGVGVQQRVDPRCGRHRPAHLEQHLLGQGEVVERVDQQRAVAVADQPGIAPAPAAVRLQVGVEAVTDLLQPALVCPPHRSRLSATRPAGR
jgi:glycosyltransferase involved in cell wall biosynthesis/GT2 family glycosyltransferase